MAKVMDLIGAIDANAKDYDVFLEDLLTVNDDLPSDVDGVNNLQNAIIAHVNSRLNQSSTRHDGLNILLRILPKCSKDVLSKYAILWIAKASQTLESGQSDRCEISLACRVLGSLIALCRDVPELQKHVSMQTVKQLIVSVSNLESDRKCGATFFLIATILYHYKEPSERLQTSIRKMILPLVDSDQKILVNAGANCYTLLARVTERSFKPPPAKPTYTGWVYSQALLCNSLHSIMDDLFAGLVELDSLDVWEKLELPEIPDDNVIEYYSALERRFANLCIYLSTMLRGCAGKNSVSPNDVLQVLCRGLAVTPSNLRNEDSFKKQMLHFILPKLHISLFAVLDAFIDGFKQELVPFAMTILQLYQQTLKWTEKAGENQTTIGGGKPFRNVRIAVYKSLTMWLTRLGSLSGIEIVSEDFLPHLLKDIKPEKDRVLLTVQKTQHLSKRALKRFKDNQYENSASLGSAEATTKNPRVNAELCKVALMALENIFVNANCKLKQTFYKSAQNVVVPLLYDFYLGNQEKNFYEEVNDCRLHLLETLRAIQLNPHPSTPPPTQYSIELFSMALKDSDANIVRMAKSAISEIEKIAHPSAPTLRLPVRIEETGKDLEIHWSRPENEENSENPTNGDGENIWEKFKEARNENFGDQEDSGAKSGTDRVLGGKTGRVLNGETVRDLNGETDRELVGESDRDLDGKPDRELDGKTGRELDRETGQDLDGPTPSKQPKLGNSEEKMDTSEDELVTTPNKDDSSTNQRSRSPFDPTSPVKQNEAGKNAEQNGSAYLTLKEIQGNDGNDEAANKKTVNDNEKIEDKIEDANADVSTRQVQQALDDNSEEEVFLSLFCDELKET